MSKDQALYIVAKVVVQHVYPYMQKNQQLTKSTEIHNWLQETHFDGYPELSELVDYWRERELGWEFNV